MRKSEPTPEPEKASDFHVFLLEDLARDMAERDFGRGSWPGIVKDNGDTERKYRESAESILWSLRGHLSKMCENFSVKLQSDVDRKVGTYLRWTDVNDLLTGGAALANAERP